MTLFRATADTDQALTRRGSGGAEVGVQWLADTDEALTRRGSGGAEVGVQWLADTDEALTRRGSGGAEVGVQWLAELGGHRLRSGGLTVWALLRILPTVHRGHRG